MSGLPRPGALCVDRPVVARFPDPGLPATAFAKARRSRDIDAGRIVATATGEGESQGAGGRPARRDRKSFHGRQPRSSSRAGAWDLAGGSLSASASYVWRAGTYYSVFNRYYSRAKSFGQTDLRVLYSDKNGRFTAIGFLKNVFDQRGSAGVSGARIANTAVGNNINNPLFNTVNQTVSYVPPRTYGVELQYRFR